MIIIRHLNSFFYSLIFFCPPAPSAAPQGVSISALSDTELKAKWNWPPWNRRNGIISGYTIHYGTDQSVYTTMELLPTQTSFTINGANAYTTYYVRVAASTSAGMGPFSAWVSARSQVAGECHSLHSQCSHHETYQTYVLCVNNK